MSRLPELLLRLLPADTRAEFGGAMAATLSERAAEAEHEGRRRQLRFLVREAAGVAGFVAGEWWTRLRARMAPATSRRRAGMGGSEIRHAARRLLRTPGFTLAAVLTLALAIGANAAIFAVVYRVVIAPLPYPDAERLVALDHAAPGVGIEAGAGMTTGLYREYGKLPSIEAIALYQRNQATLTGDGDPERLTVLFVTPSLGEIVGARMALGQWFSAGISAEDAPVQVVLTHDFWMDRFGGAQDVVGSTVRLDGRARQVIGVLARDVHLPLDAPLLRALVFDPADAEAGGFNYGGIARIRDDVSIDMLRAQQNAVIADLPARFPDQLEIATAMTGEVRLASLTEPLKDSVLGNVSQMLWVLLGSVAIVLLIACANLANLFLVRTDARQREIAVRRALGAGPGRVLGYYLAETVQIAMVSGAAGLLLAIGAVRLLLAYGPTSLPRLDEVRIDTTVVAVTAVISLLAGLLFGLMPLVRRTAPVSGLLGDGARGNTAGVARQRGRLVLMTVQVALAVVLTSGAALMLQTFMNLRSADPGFATESRLTFSVGLPGADFPDADAAARFHEQMLERARGLPGVVAAAITTTLPLSGDGWGDPLEVSGRPMQPGQMGPVARFRRVSTDYFDVMGMQIRAGRGLQDADMQGHTNAVVIDEALADAYFPGEDPLGQQVRVIGQDDGWLTVVGVVTNTVTFALAEETPTPKLYFPLRSSFAGGSPSTHSASYVVQTNGAPLQLVPALRRVLGELAPSVAMAQPAALTELVARASARAAFTMVLLLIAAGVALLLGVIGVYAVISYSTSRRAAEIGVRLALGAAPGEVRAMVLRQSTLAVGGGIAAGTLAALLFGRALQALLFGIAWNDAVTYVVVASAMFVVAMAACWVPAARAARTSVLESLR